METPNSHQIDMQINTQSNEQAGNPINNIFTAVTTTNIFTNTAKVIATDVVQPRCGSLMAIYSNAGFENSEEHSSVDVIEAI